jgi:hypothetical protein
MKTPPCSYYVTIAFSCGGDELVDHIKSDLAKEGNKMNIAKSMVKKQGLKHGVQVATTSDKIR